MGVLSKYAICTLPAVLWCSSARQGIALFIQLPEQRHLGGVERASLATENFFT